MGIFSVNYDAAEQFAAIENGTYEVYVAQAEQSATQSGTDFLDIRLKIRDDFTQKFRNNMIFDKVYVNKSTLEYPLWVLQAYCKATKVPEKTDIQSIEQFLDLIKGKSMKVTVENETSEWNGKTYENLRVKKREQSELPPYSAKTEKAPEVSDLDLPF